MTAILIIAKNPKGLEIQILRYAQNDKNKGGRKGFSIRQIKRAMCMFRRVIAKIKQGDKLGTSPFVLLSRPLLSHPLLSQMANKASPCHKQSVPMPQTKRPHATHATHLCLPTIISSYIPTMISSYSKPDFLYIINKSIN